MFAKMLSSDKLSIYDGEDIWSHNSEYGHIQIQGWKKHLITWKEAGHQQ